MSITIRDVAQAAGVSTATVSRALRGMPNVDQATRDRVMKVAADLDYVVSPSASRLASGRTGSIGVITPYIARWFFATVLSGIESTLQAANMDLLLMGVGANPDGEIKLPAVQRLRRRVDGVIIVALPPDDPQLLEVINLGLPTCLIGSTFPNTPSICIDDVEAGRIATQHLLNLGHKRIGLISGHPADGNHNAEYDRARGYYNAMTQAGITPDESLISYGYFTVDGGEKAMSALLAKPQPPSAVFAMSDEMGFGALRSLKSHGLTSGEDVSIVGIDGHDMSDIMNLTTVEQPVYQMGAKATESLLLQINNPLNYSTEQAILATHLMVRDSTRAARE